MCILSRTSLKDCTLILLYVYLWASVSVSAPRVGVRRASNPLEIEKQLLPTVWCECKVFWRNRELWTLRKLYNHILSFWGKVQQMLGRPQTPFVGWGLQTSDLPFPRIMAMCQLARNWPKGFIHVGQTLYLLNHMLSPLLEDIFNEVNMYLYIKRYNKYVFMVLWIKFL